MDFTNQTSQNDLYQICKELGISNVKVIRKDQLKNTLKNKYISNIIINLDSFGCGTHWVYLSPLYKIYFDSYAQPAPLEVPKNYRLASQIKQIQSIEATDCGALCCLFAYYLNFKSKKDYYKLFKDCY